MWHLNFTACSRDGGTEYDPLQKHGLMVSAAGEGGDGSSGSPGQIRVRIENTGSATWRGVIRVSLRTGENPRFFLPGFLYGTNRGEAPLVVDSKCPRLRAEEDFPASSWWTTRADRLSHPCAFAFADGRITGLAAAPYYVMENEKIRPWEPSAQGEFRQFAGFGCSLEPGELIYTLGYENAPWMFVDSHHYLPRQPLGKNCFALYSGEAVEFSLYCFDYPSPDERGLYEAISWVYHRYHQAPRRLCSVRQTVADLAGAVSRDAWIAEKHTYSGFVFDRDGCPEYKILPSIAWTNGLASAEPMLQAALRLGRPDIRQQALDCVEHIVRHSVNPDSGLPYMAENEAGWNNRGWWYDRQPVPGHAAYLVGQCVYLVLRAFVWERDFQGVCHEGWLEFARSILSRTENARNGDGEYPYIFSEKTGAGLEYDSLSGAWCLAAAAYYAQVSGDHTRLPQLLCSERHYYDRYVRRMECYGGPLDIDKNVDSEGVLAYLRAVHFLHAITERKELLSHMRDGLGYEFTFKFCYNVPIRIPPLSSVGWSSCGGSITSVTNPHIHPMSSSILDEVYYYLSLRKDPYIQSRLEDTLLWSCQCHNTFDGEYGYGKRGWMSERFCHSEGLLLERYPDGSPASTWFALMPWACGSLLEGLTGKAWEENGLSSGTGYPASRTEEKA